MSGCRIITASMRCADICTSARATSRWPPITTRGRLLGRGARPSATTSRCKPLGCATADSSFDAGTAVQLVGVVLRGVGASLVTAQVVGVQFGVGLGQPAQEVLANAGA